MEQTEKYSAVPQDFEIIDVHNHVFPDKVALRGAESIRDYYELPLRGDGTLDTVLESASRYNVRHLVLCSAALRPEKVHTANAFIAQLRERDPRLVALGTTHAEAEDQEAVFREIEELGLSGVKLHPEFQGFAIDDARLFPAYREAARLKIPVLFHVGDPKSSLSSPDKVYRVMEKVPELTIVAAHMGGYKAKDAAECLVGTPCYFDTSQWFYYLTEAELLERIEKHGTDKILFGSDYPLNVPAEEIERLYAVHLDDVSKRKIFYENAKKLFRL